MVQRRWRYSELNWLRRIVNSQARKFVPGSNCAIRVSARTMVSWTRSSARSGLAVKETAKARRRGTVARISLRKAAESGRLLDCLREVLDRAGIDSFPQSRRDPCEGRGSSA